MMEMGAKHRGQANSCLQLPPEEVAHLKMQGKQKAWPQVVVWAQIGSSCVHE